jgi:hypothetical protein
MAILKVPEEHIPIVLRSNLNVTVGSTCQQNQQSTGESFGLTQHASSVMAHLVLLEENEQNNLQHLGLPGLLMIVVTQVHIVL